METDLYNIEYNETQGIFHCSSGGEGSVPDWKIVGEGLLYDHCSEFINKMMAKFAGINAGGKEIPTHARILKEFGAFKLS